MLDLLRHGAHRPQGGERRPRPGHPALTATGGRIVGSRAEHPRPVAAGDHGTPEALTALPELSWELDATRQALDLAAQHVKLPEPMCGELGRRLLLQKLEMRRRDLRRVEKVTFERDRTIDRHNAIELLVPDDAPLVVDGEQQPYWLVPLSVMRRRTLVNLVLTNEEGHRITTPGLRVVQQLDESVLLAAAAAALPSPLEEGTAHELEDFVRRFVAGERADVLEMAARLDGGTTDLMRRLADDEVFMWAFGRLRHGYTLYVFLSVARGRHRLLHMSFTEPTRWAYQRPRLDRPRAGEAGPHCQYRTGQRIGRLEWTHLAARLGLRATRIRFQVPSAEAAASYHFEVTAPPGVRMEKATLLAGRPNEVDASVSLDRVEGHAPTIGLHVVEVPTGSCCRVQLDVGIPTRGWLTTMVASSWVILAALAVVSMPWTIGTGAWAGDEVRDLVLVLVTTSAGVAALIASNDFGEVARRLVAPLRVLGAIAVTLPVVQAGLLVLAPEPTTARTSWTWGEHLILACAASIVVLITSAWVRSSVSEHADRVRSPWDMTVDEPLHLPRRFWEAVDRYGFRSPAVGIESAEAWLEEYRWTDAKHSRAVAVLGGTPRPARPGVPACAHGSFPCCTTAGCPSRQLTAVSAPE